MPERRCLEAGSELRRTPSTLQELSLPNLEVKNLELEGKNLELEGRSGAIHQVWTPPPLGAQTVRGVRDRSCRDRAPLGLYVVVLSQKHQLRLASQRPVYLNFGAAFSWSAEAFMVACHFLSVLS